MGNMRPETLTKKVISNLSIWILGLFITIFVSGCVTGHCRGKDAGQEKVFVFKPDGSKQCSKKMGASIEQMAQELKGLEILSQENRHDGQMHVTLCGSPTGKINVYEIRKADLQIAIQAGFEELK